MRLVFVPHAYYPSIGGAEAYTRGLAESVARHGWQVHVVAPDIDNPEAFYELGHGPAGNSRQWLDGVEVRRLPFINLFYRLAPQRLSRRAIGSAIGGYTDALRSVLAELRPDAVMTLPHLFPNVEATFGIGRDAKWPLVYAPMLHEHDPNWSVERFAPFAASADGAVALTSHERSRLLESYGCRGETTVVVPPGVEVEDLGGEVEREPLILFVGRRTPSKRLDVLLDAMETVWARHPEARLVIAGPPGPGSEELDARLGSHPGVELAGRVSDKKRRDLYLRALTAVNPSLTESFGLTTLEAWAHGTPIVVPDIPVNRSVIEAGIDGVLTRSDATSLAAGIATLLEDPAQARRMGEAGWARARRDFSWDRAGAALMKLVETV